MRTRSAAVFAVAVVLAACASCGGTADDGPQGSSAAARSSGVESPGLAAVAVGVRVWVLDEGQQWRAMPRASGLKEANGVAFGDSSHGWVVGADGVLEATSDGGVTWQSQSVGSGARDNGWLDKVACADADNVWVVGDAAFSSSDAGETWWRRYQAETYVVAVRDVADVWISGNYGLRSTTDGGRTWRKVRAPALHGGVFSAIAFGRGADVWVSGSTAEAISHARVWRSTDDGMSWRVWKLGGSGAEDVAVDSSGAVHVVIDDRIVSSADQGRHWTTFRCRARTQPELSAIAFRDARNGWAVGELDYAGGYHGVIYSTTDGGVNWQREALPARSQFFLDVAPVPPGADGQ